MELKEVYENLCCYDNRSEMFNILMGDVPQKERIKPRQDNCSCDSCFYGRDALAIEIIKLTETLKIARKLL